MNAKEQKRLAREAEKATAIQARADAWQARVHTHFEYLQAQYGFCVTHVDASSSWTTRIIYQTETTGIYVDCSYEDRHAEVSLVRLLDGKLPKYPIFVKQDTMLYDFPLENLLLMRAPHLLTELRAVHGLSDEQIEATLKLLAQILHDYAADVLRGDFSIFATLEELVKKRTQRFRKREREEKDVPQELQFQFRSITSLTDGFCEQYLDNKDADLCSKLTRILCQKQPSPLAQGKYPTWACAIIHALCITNLLFEPPQKPYISEDEVMNYFGPVSKTLRAKSRLIRELVDMYPLSPDWTFSSIDDKNGPLI